MTFYDYRNQALEPNRRGLYPEWYGLFIANSQSIQFSTQWVWVQARNSISAIDIQQRDVNRVYAIIHQLDRKSVV